ncbi:dGTPase [Providencia rettgeri]|uniref:dGTPase n=1 Tax=Providencia hangzhouensis TaxID=3031799 RepID=UPI0032DD7CD6
MQNLIQSARSRKSQAAHTTLISETQSDRARLLYSAPFRRLQQKAQVFSLESNSAVRSRLTHSIEVSHIGRYIVAKIYEYMQAEECTSIDKSQKKFWEENILSLSNIVETACLMHDIGNPPFGHFGEAAIVAWAEDADNTQKLINSVFKIKNTCDVCSEQYTVLFNDFKYFDGNPQGLRIITKLQGDDGYNGLNLTYTQLVSFLKYTYSSNDIHEKQDSTLPFSKKIGFFETESKLIHDAWDYLKMGENKRHPLSFIMEASDDISYCISDIEDGIEKGIISLSHFRDYLLINLKPIRSKHSADEFLDYLINSLSYEKENRNINVFLDFKTKLSNKLVELVANNFIHDYNSYVKLKATEQIIKKGSLEYDLLEILKTYTSKYLFTSYDAESIELSGYSIISGILKKYEKLLALPKDKFLILLSENNNEIRKNNLDYHRRLYNRLPARHIKAYKSAIIGNEIEHIESVFAEKEILNERLQKQNDLFYNKYFEIDSKVEWKYRIHLVIDFISGMTDQFAMDFYQQLKGINVKL